MGKLCPKGKAAAKRKFKVYPSAYANMYASAVCSGKVTPGGNGTSQARKAISGSRKMKFSKGGANIVAAGCGAVKEGSRKSTRIT